MQSKPPKRPRPNGKPANPFAYGWRYVTRLLPNGRKDLDRIPLTLEDVLHPREGDVIPEAPRHELERDYLAGVFRTRRGRRRGFWVFSDCLIDWGIAGLRDP